MDNKDPNVEVTETFSMFQPIFNFMIPFTKLRISIDRQLLKDAAADELRKELKVRGFWK
jgi:hypothetical protein